MDKMGFINFCYQLNQFDHPICSSCATLFSASIFFLNQTATFETHFDQLSQLNYEFLF